jgi:hypothetical protein
VKVDTIIFVGPSLYGMYPEPQKGELWCKPAKQGDVLGMYLHHNPKTIVLIDGTFHQTLATWVKELVYIMMKGCRFIGAASMGALRATELWRYGAIGVGQIFDEYKSGLVEDDAYVAMSYDPTTFKPLTNPPCGMEKKRWDALSAIEFARTNKHFPKHGFNEKELTPCLGIILDRILAEQILLIS